TRVGVDVELRRDRAAQIRAEVLGLELLGMGPLVLERSAHGVERRLGKPGICTGPDSLRTSPLRKKRTASLPPDAFMPKLLPLPRRSDVELEFFSTLNDVKLSSAQSPWPSVTSVHRWSEPSGRSGVAAAAVTCPHDAKSAGYGVRSLIVLPSPYQVQRVSPA